MIVTRWQAPRTPTKDQVVILFEAEGYEPYEEVCPAQSQVKEHRHPFDEIRMVFEGELLLNISGNQLLLRPGDRIEIPANTRHSTSVQTTDPCLCICAHRAF